MQFKGIVTLQALDAETLTAIFNNADVGKTIEIDCTRVWDM